MEILKRYYTDLLTGPVSFADHQNKAITLRRSCPVLPGLTPRDVKTLLLAPLLFRYPKEVESTPEVRTAARALILSVLQEGQSTDKIREFLSVFADFSEKDAQQLRQGLFHNRYELSRVVQAEPVVAPTLEKIEKQIQRLGWEAEYLVFVENKKHEAMDRLVSTMDRAFWDVLRDRLAHKDFSMLHDTIVELSGLMREIHHPFLSDRGEAYLEDLFSNTSMWTEGDSEKSKQWFGAVLQYLKECDAVAMEDVYDRALVDLDVTTDLVVHGLETVYALLLPLRANIFLLEKDLR